MDEKCTTKNRHSVSGRLFRLRWQQPAQAGSLLQWIVYTAESLFSTCYYPVDNSSGVQSKLEVEHFTSIYLTQNSTSTLRRPFAGMFLGDCVFN